MVTTDATLDVAEYRCKRQRMRHDGSLKAGMNEWFCVLALALVVNNNKKGLAFSKVNKWKGTAVSEVLN